MLNIENAKKIIRKEMPDREIVVIKPFQDDGYVCAMPGKGMHGNDVSSPFFFIDGRTGEITKINPIRDIDKMKTLTS